MKSTKNYLIGIRVDYRNRRIKDQLTINNTRISKNMKEFQSPQKRWTTKEKDRQTKIHEAGNGLHFVSYDNVNEYDINLNKTVRQLTGYGVEKI
jgi:hypothetical protein